MKNKKALLVGLFLLLGIIGIGVKWAIIDRSEELNSQSKETHENEEKSVHLTDDEINEFEIVSEVAKPGKIKAYLSLSGEIKFNENQFVHIVPRVDGVVKEVYKTVGDQVTQNELLATIESKELADLKSDLLQAHERLKLAESRFEREKRLFEKMITPEQEYLDARKNYEEEKINLQSAEQKLHAIGYTDIEVEDIKNRKEHSLTLYEMRSPIRGRVVEKHLTLGEKIDNNTNAFTIANLENVWVNLTIYQKDLNRVKLDQAVSILSKSQNSKESGTIEYISSFLDESTRTATARVVLNNQSNDWKPGMFIIAQVEVEEQNVPLRIYRSAIQVINGQKVVFLKEGNSFHPVAITLGKEGEDYVEVLSGLQEGEEYVKKNGFVLKAELEKETFGGGHGH